MTYALFRRHVNIVFILYFSTVAEQIEQIKTKFKITEMVFVGDRGMVKAKTKATLTEQGLRYITALTDPQIRTLLKRDVLQLNLFDETLQGVEEGERRLILRRNEALRHKFATRRQDKLARLSQKVAARRKQRIRLLFFPKIKF